MVEIMETEAIGASIIETGSLLVHVAFCSCFGSFEGFVGGFCDCGKGGKDDFGGWVEEDLGRVENLTGAKDLGCGSLRDMYIWDEGEPETALKVVCVGDEFVHCVTASPLKMAEGSIRPASA